MQRYATGELGCLFLFANQWNYKIEQKCLAWLQIWSDGIISFHTYLRLTFCVWWPFIHFYLHPCSLFLLKGEKSFWKSVFCSEWEVIGFFYVNLLTKKKSIGHCEIIKAIEPACFTQRINIVRWSCEDKISSPEKFLLWNGFLISEVNEDVSKWDEVLPNGIAFTSKPTWKKC